VLASIFLVLAPIFLAPVKFVANVTSFLNYLTYKTDTNVVANPAGGNEIDYFNRNIRI